MATSKLAALRKELLRQHSIYADLTARGQRVPASSVREMLTKLGWMLRQCEALNRTEADDEE